MLLHSRRFRVLLSASVACLLAGGLLLEPATVPNNVAFGQEQSSIVSAAVKPKATITPETTEVSMTIPYDAETAETSIVINTEGIKQGSMMYGPAYEDGAVFERLYLNAGVLTITAKAAGQGQILIMGSGDDAHSNPDPALIVVTIAKQAAPPKPPVPKPPVEPKPPVPQPPTPQPQHPSPQEPTVDIGDGQGSSHVMGGTVSTSLKPSSRKGYSTLTATLQPEADNRAHAVTILVNDKPQWFLPGANGSLVLDVPNTGNVKIVPTFKAHTAPRGWFSDVIEGAWYEEVAYQAYNLGYMRGFIADGLGTMASSWVHFSHEVAPLAQGKGKSPASTEKFGVDETLARAQAAVIFFNMAGGTYAIDGRYNAGIHAYPNVFPDVEDGIGNAYLNAVLWAKEHGLIMGYADTKTFGPEDKLTRAQICTIIARYAQLDGTPLTYTTFSEEEIDQILSSFPDAHTVENWARASVAWAARHGYIGQGGFLAGDSPITNAEMAAVMTRIQPERISLGLFPTA